MTSDKNKPTLSSTSFSPYRDWKTNSTRLCSDELNDLIPTSARMRSTVIG